MICTPHTLCRVQVRRWADSYKGVGMPRPKKKKLDEARERLLKQVDSIDAENTAPQAVLELEQAVSFTGSAVRGCCVVDVPGWACEWLPLGMRGGE